MKVVNSCAINGCWWVFGSAATDLRYEVSIDDYATASLDSEGASEERVHELVSPPRRRVDHRPQ